MWDSILVGMDVGYKALGFLLVVVVCGILLILALYITGLFFGTLSRVLSKQKTRSEFNKIVNNKQ